MKCPKCKYVSHDYLDVCRKCSSDLLAFKQQMGLLVLQPAGGLDLSLAIGSGMMDDPFGARTLVDTALHADDDEFDISLDDDHPVFHPHSASGDHLTLELDASDLASDPRFNLPQEPATPADDRDLPVSQHLTLEMDMQNVAFAPPPATPQARWDSPEPPPPPQVFEALDMLSDTAPIEPLERPAEPPSGATAKIPTIEIGDSGSLSVSDAGLLDPAAPANFEMLTDDRSEALAENLDLADADLADTDLLADEGAPTVPFDFDTPADRDDYAARAARVLGPVNVFHPPADADVSQEPDEAEAASPPVETYGAAPEAGMSGLSIDFLAGGSLEGLSLEGLSLGGLSRIDEPANPDAQDHLTIELDATELTTDLADASIDEVAFMTGQHPEPDLGALPPLENIIEDDEIHRPQGIALTSAEDTARLDETAEIAVPGHLTLELYAEDLSIDLAAESLEEDALLGDDITQAQAAPPGGHIEEELLLDLDDFDLENPEER